MTETPALPKQPGGINWKEIEFWVDTYRTRIQGLFLNRILIPKRDLFPGSFISGEYVLIFGGTKREESILIGLRPNHPYFAISSHVKWKAAPQATLPPILLAASKHLTGKKLVDWSSLKKERIFTLWFEDSEPLGWVHQWIPKKPQSILLKKSEGGSHEPTYLILSESSTAAEKTMTPQYYVFPSGKGAPENPLIREIFKKSSVEQFEEIQDTLGQEARSLKQKVLSQNLLEKKKNYETKLLQLRKTLLETEKEPNWNDHGELLKASFHQPQKIRARDEKETDSKKEKKWIRILWDYEKDQEVEIPWDPKWNQQEPKQILDHFFQLGRRKQKRLQESKTQIDNLEESLRQTRVSLSALSGLDANQMTDLSSSLGLQKEDGRQKPKDWRGKTFLASNGCQILVGRNRIENHQLTFKIARGNDLWLHVRGRPGAHIVIQLPWGQSASLETLIEASMLAIFYSGGKEWGKTEVDYTFRKYVKKIKNSSEVSYTQNKSLMVEIDPQKLKKLLENV